MSKKGGLGVVTTVINLLQSSIHIISGILELAALEFELAKRSIITIIILSVICFMFVTTLWCSLLALLVYWLTTLDVSIIISLCIGFSINLLLLLFFGFMILRYRQDIKFSATRRQLTNVKSSL